MKEILGGDLDVLFTKHNIIAVKTYEAKTYLDDKTQVWELDDKQYEVIEKISEDEYLELGCWWRYSNGSNLKDSIEEYTINGVKLKAFDNDYLREQNRKDFAEDLEEGEEPYEEPRAYKTLFDYINEEIGASTLKNVTAVSIHIAQLNNMKLSELLIKCQVTDETIN